MAKQERIATEKTTGRRYLVQRLDLRAGEVWCWGEVVGFRGLATKHGPSKTFKAAEVEIANGEKTVELVFALAIQRCQVEGRAWRITRGGNLRVGPTAEEAKAARDFNEALATELRKVPGVAALLGL